MNVHDVERPWGTGEQLAGKSLAEVAQRISAKMAGRNPVKDPGTFTPPASTLNRQLTAEDRSILGGSISGKPGGHAGYGR